MTGNAGTPSSRLLVNVFTICQRLTDIYCSSSHERTLKPLEASPLSIKAPRNIGDINTWTHWLSRAPMKCSDQSEGRIWSPRPPSHNPSGLTVFSGVMETKKHSNGCVVVVVVVDNTGPDAQPATGFFLLTGRNLEQASR